MPAPVSTSSINELPGVTDPGDNNKIILRGRIKDAASLASVHWTFFYADWESSRQRALNQSQVDLAPPYSTGNDRRLGLVGRTNVNWGFATQAIKDKERPFTDILETIDVFGSTPTEFGEQAERDNWEPILAEEITRTIRGWDQFHALWQQNAHIFTMEGLSFTFFEDCRNWQWRVYGQQFFKFPRRVLANVNKLDIVTCQVDLMPHELYDKVRNPEVAAMAGWNREAVLKAIQQTAAQHGIQGNDPQQWEQTWKDNDIMYSVTTTTVQVIYGFVKEVDGSVSVTIGRLDGEGPFLYQSKPEYSYRCMSQMLTAYADGVGTNGDFQSIRGAAQELFASSGAINRLLCKYVDMGCHVSTPHVTCENEDVVQENAFRPIGPYVGVTNGVGFVEVKTPPFDQTLIPVLDSLVNVFNNRGGRFAPGMRSSSRTQKTATQVDREDEIEGALSTGQMFLFFVAWGNHFKEIVRRLIQPDYRQDEPGGQEVWEMRARLLNRGVPLEALYGIDLKRIEINTGVGKGSLSERRSVARALLEMVFPSADEYGKQIIVRMVAIAYAGVRIGSQIIPQEPGLRPPVDETIAELENNDLANGEPIEVKPNQNHAAHLKIHLQRLQVVNGQLTEMQIGLEEAIPQMFPIWEHGNQHLLYMNPNSPVTAGFKEALQQLGEVIINGQKHLDAEARKAEEAQGGAQQQGGGTTSPGILVQAAEAQYQLRKLQLDLDDKRIQAAVNARKDMLELAKQRQQLAAEDIKTAAKLRNEKRITDAKIENQKRTTDAKVAAQKRGNSRKPAKAGK